MKKRLDSKARENLPMDVLRKFRMIINAAKQQFRWMEEQCGVNGASLWALWEINNAPGLRVSDLMVALAMHQSSTSNLVEKLVQRKLVKRVRSRDDQRVVTLEVTKRGVDVLRKCPKPARGILPEALHRLPKAHLEALNSSLLALLHAMKTADKSAMSRPLALIFANDETPARKKYGISRTVRRTFVVR